MKRDITPPLRDPEPRARGGMTVVDESAWKRAINEYTKAESIAFLRAADQFASGVEKHMRARPDLSFEVVCAGIGEAPLAPDAAALREFWIYGERFWAWWQGRLRHEGLRECRMDDEAAVPPVVITLAVEGSDRSAETLDALSRSLDPRPVLTLADGTTVRADEVWEDRHGGGCANVGRVAYFCHPGQAWERSTTDRPWSDTEFASRRSKTRRVYPPVDAAPSPAAAHLSPGDQTRTHTGWHTVTAAEHPAYPHVATGLWFRGAILETRRKDEAKPTTLAAPPGCDPGGPARNVPIRVGDYVRARDKSGRCDFDFWARVTGVSDAASEYVKCVGLDPACEYHVPLSCVADHRPAPRITLPDGREVVPERMWRQRSEFGNLEIVQVEGRCFVHRPSESWEPADYWTRNVPDPNYYRRVWPPADVEGV